MKKLLLALITIIALNSNIFAETAIEKNFCLKMKECTLEKIGVKERKMMEGMTDSMCKTVIGKMNEAKTKDASLASLVDNCIDSMSKLDCAEFLKESGVDTPECNTLKTEADKIAKDTK